MGLLPVDLERQAPRDARMIDVGKAYPVLGEECLLKATRAEFRNQADSQNCLRNLPSQMLTVGCASPIRSAARLTLRV